MASVVLLIVTAGCGGGASQDRQPHPVTLRIGFGLAAGTSPEIGIQQTIRNIALRGLVTVDQNGRAKPVLADRWTESDDGLRWRFHIRQGATFHDGSPVTADGVRGALVSGLPQTMGSAYDDIDDVRTIDAETIEFVMKRRSSFLLEALDVQIEAADSPLVGTGPFMVTNRSGDRAEMAANTQYYAGRPAIDRLVIVTYDSVRSAWADLLRGEVDMLYDVGVEALDSLESSRNVNIFTFQRGYAYMLLLNLRRAHLRDSAFRRRLNAAIDRDALIEDALIGHGRPAQGAVWPEHWAYRPDFPHFTYDARQSPGADRRMMRILFGEPALERLALVVQRQLQSAGFAVELESVPADRVVPRLAAGDFDAVLSDYRQGPNMVRPYLFWHSGAPFNFGAYSNRNVDAALDAIRYAADDAAYAAGVAAFERGMVDDPPAVFLSWRERARVVSTRFDVPLDRTVDALGWLHLWKPAAGGSPASKN